MSVQTQTQVAYSLLETRAARSMQRQFQRLMSESLPDEQRRQVSEELWSTRLLTFGLARHLDGLNAVFAPALSLVVHGVVLAANALLCKEGTPSSAAFQVLSGRLSVIKISWARTMPDVTEETWVGEVAFVCQNERRRNTVAARRLTWLMAVPADVCHLLISTPSLALVASSTSVTPSMLSCTGLLAKSERRTEF